MPLPKDKWPHIYFYDVRKQDKVKVHKDHLKLKSGSTKGHGPGKYFQLIAVKSGRRDYDLYKFVSEEKYDMYKQLLAGKTSVKKSKPKSKPRSSRCNKKTRDACKSSTRTCSWIKGVRGQRKGYCRKKP